MLLENAPVLNGFKYNMSPFKPSFLIQNAHIQTLLPYYFRPTPKLTLTRTRIALPDSDFVDVDIQPAKESNTPCPVLILFHGLEGSAQSKYILSLLNIAKQNNWHGYAVNFKGCSGEPNTTPSTYHSGETATAQTVVDYVKQKHPNAPIFAIGYSLGGSALLNTLAKCDQARHITAACAVSVPYDLARSAHHMNTGLSKLYRNHFIKSLKEKIHAKKHIIEQHGIELDYERMEQCQDFWGYDDCITAPLNGFKDVHDYYTTCSTLEQLKNINCPTLLIHALDDPFMTPECAPNPQNLPTAITLALSPKGGHVGFVGGSPLSGLDFDGVDRQILDFIHTFLPQHSKHSQNE